VVVVVEEEDEGRKAVQAGVPVKGRSRLSRLEEKEESEEEAEEEEVDEEEGEEEEEEEEEIEPDPEEEERFFFPERDSPIRRTQRRLARIMAPATDLK